MIQWITAVSYRNGFIKHLQLYLHLLTKKNRPNFQITSQSFILASQKSLYSITHTLFAIICFSKQIFAERLSYNNPKAESHRQITAS